MSDSSKLMAAPALEAMGDIDVFAADGPIRPFRNLVDFIRDNVKTMGKDTLITIAESAWDFVASHNFQQIPDVIEVPLKTWLRSQIRPLIESLYAGS